MAMRLDHGADELTEVHDKPIYLTLKSDRSLAIRDNPLARERLAGALDAATNGDKEERIFMRADRSIPLRRCHVCDQRMRAARYLKVALVGLEMRAAQ
jgi:biopolymer transport protein ExbD